MQASQNENTEEKGRSRTRSKSGLAAAVGLLSFGAAALIVSIVFNYSILAFTGLGLVFWGAILLYIQPEEHVRKVLLDATAMPLLVVLDKLMEELDYAGKAVYLPPEYSKDPEESRVYIPKRKEGKIPSADVVLKHEGRLFIKNPEGILLTAPGAELTRLFEKTLETSFSRVDLKYLEQNLPKLFVADLEIARDLQIEYSQFDAKTTDPNSPAQPKDDAIRVRVTDSIFQGIRREDAKLSKIYDSVGCPISSAIACALAKATGKPVVIQDTRTSEDGSVVEVTYGFLG